MHLLHTSLVAATLGSLALGQSASFTPTGFFPQNAESTAWAIAPDGSVVGGVGARQNGATEEAFIYSAGSGLVGIGHLPGGGLTSDVAAFSADGTVQVGSSDAGSAASEAFRRQGGAMLGLGDLPGGAAVSYGRDCSADGSIVVGVGTTGVGHMAFKWEASTGTMQSLGSLPGGVGVSRALAVTPDGDVTVGWADTSSEWWPFRHTEGGGMQHLSGSLQSMAGGRATDVDDDGDVIVGWAVQTTFHQHAFRWTPTGGMQVLGYLPGGMNVATAMAVSGDGQVVVGSQAFISSFEATIWTPAGGMRALKDVLETEGGLDLTGYQLYNATAISQDGRRVAGLCVNPSGKTVGFVCELPCAAPTTYCTTSPNSVGAGALIGAVGTGDVSVGSLSLVTTGAVPNQFGLYFYGSVQASVPFGDGVRCIGPGSTGLWRLPIQQADGAGVMTHNLDFGAALPPLAALAPGMTWNFQLWYRDPSGAGSGFNLSNALSVPFCE